MIGFYDSGIGGLTIFREIQKLYPNLPFQYLADTAILPIGDKTIDEIQKQVKWGCTFLFEHGCEIIILVCNTACVTSIRHIQQVWLPVAFPSKQVLSITHPFIELVQSQITNLAPKQGLLMATQATYESGFYQHEFKNLGLQNLKAIPCPGLAQAIEQDNLQQIEALLKEYIFINQLQPEQMDYILLACTHYPLATESIQKYFPTAKLLEPSLEVATSFLDYLERHKEYQITNGEKTFWVTGEDNSSLRRMLSKEELNLISAHY